MSQLGFSIRFTANTLPVSFSLLIESMTQSTLEENCQKSVSGKHKKESVNKRLNECDPRLLQCRNSARSQCRRSVLSVSSSSRHPVFSAVSPSLDTESSRCRRELRDDSVRKAQKEFVSERLNECESPASTVKDFNKKAVLDLNRKSISAKD